MNGTFEIGASLATALSTVDGLVLLVDDLVGTGWTATLAARELRQAGVAAVYPLALAISG